MVFRTLILLTLLLCLSLAPIHAQKRRSTAPATLAAPIYTVAAEPPGPKLPADAERRRTAFLEVWSGIAERYYDPTFSSLDWKKIRAEFEPKAIAAKSDQELYGLLRQMIGRLQRSHLLIIPPEVYQAIEETKARAKERETGKLERRLADQSDPQKPSDIRWLANDPATPHGLGIDLVLLDDKFIITRVDKDSAAENAGLKPGHAIEQINGVSLDEMMNRIIISYGSVKLAEVSLHIPWEVVESVINGEEDSYVEVNYSDGTGETKDVRIRREPLRRDRIIMIAPNFPPRTFSFESRSLDNATGYIRFNFFAAALLPKFCDAIAEHANKESLIIDLRGNSGGLMASLPIMVGMLTERRELIGTMRSRRSDQPLLAQPKTRNFKGRIVVLTDSRTASAAEIFALALRERGRAALVGEKSAGAALPSTGLRLSTGAMFILPIANFTSGLGQQIEGTGIMPDETVTWHRTSLLSGTDRQLDAGRKLAADPRRLAALLGKPKSTTAAPPLELRGPVASGAPPLPDFKGPVAGGAPPPPPPVKKVNTGAAGRGSGFGSGLTSSAATDTRVFKPGHDATSRRILDEFFRAVGGKDALKAVGKYTLKGSTRVSAPGFEIYYDFSSYREFPDKYAENLISENLGETRQVSVADKFITQSSLGGSVELPLKMETKDVDPLGAIFALGDPETAFPNLSFTGEYLRDGRKTMVIEGRLPNVGIVALAFDVDTKLLVNFSAASRSVSFGDYRKVGSILLPFHIEREGAVTSVFEYDLVSPIDPAEFQKKQFCFDVAN